MSSPPSYKITTDFKSFNDRTFGPAFELNFPYKYEEFKDMINDRKKNKFIITEKGGLLRHCCTHHDDSNTSNTEFFFSFGKNFKSKRSRQVTVYSCKDCIEKECEYKLGIVEESYFTDDEWKRVLEYYENQ